jgi:hypothetical protein
LGVKHVVIEKVLYKVRFASVMSVFAGVFFVSGKEWTILLSDVFLITLGTGKLVYPTSIAFVVQVVISFSQQSVDVIPAGE